MRLESCDVACCEFGTRMTKVKNRIWGKVEMSEALPRPMLSLRIRHRRRHVTKLCKIRSHCGKRRVCEQPEQVELEDVDDGQCFSESAYMGPRKARCEFEGLGLEYVELNSRKGRW